MCIRDSRYLDLVDTHNGNAYVTMAGGQKMNIYWPVPEDAKEDSAFHIVHFGGLNRESNADMNDLLRNHIPEELSSEKVFIDGQAFIKFSVGSFSPVSYTHLDVYKRQDLYHCINDPGNWDHRDFPWGICNVV